jgi:hypothetical protein
MEKVEGAGNVGVVETETAKKIEVTIDPGGAPHQVRLWLINAAVVRRLWKSQTLREVSVQKGDDEDGVRGPITTKVKS